MFESWQDFLRGVAIGVMVGAIVGLAMADYVGCATEHAGVRPWRYSFIAGCSVQEGDGMWVRSNEGRER